jgi:hypothetical protein
MEAGWSFELKVSPCISNMTRKMATQVAPAPFVRAGNAAAATPGAMRMAPSTAGSASGR